MNRRLGLLWLALLVALSPCGMRADTITLRSNAEINGRVQYENDEFTIAARYHDGERSITFDRREILTVEINSRQFNAGEPPKNISVLEARSTGTRDASRDNTGGSGTRSDSRLEKRRQHPAGKTQSTMSPDSVDRAKTDVVWLRNQTKLLGRLVSLRKGQLTIKSGQEDKNVDVQEVLTVLVAPE